jgi:hypothetical protein
MAYEKPCVFCGGELGEEDDWNAPMRMHKNVRACIVVLRTRLDRLEWLPLTYDEISNIIEALQWYMKGSKDDDFQPLIDKLRSYHRR